MKNLSDIEIIESIARGNQSDFALLVDKYKNKAYSLLVRMLKNEMEAEEVLQDCFLKAFKSLGSFRFESKFSTWFYRIVYNSALTKLSTQKRKIENEMISLDELLGMRSNLDYKVTETQDLTDFLQKIISQLPANYASVINMFYLDNMNCEEISGVMGITVSNVKVMLYRSRNVLRELLIKNNYQKELL